MKLTHQMTVLVAQIRMMVGEREVGSGGYTIDISLAAPYNKRICF